MRRAFGIFLTLFITAIFLIIALYPVNFPQLFNALVNADHRLMLIAAAFAMLDYVLRTVRWQRFLAPTKRISLGRLFPVLIVGFALNNLLPGRPGEFARPYWLKRREDVSLMLGFGTIVVERVADGIMLILFLVGALLIFKPLGLELPFLTEEITLFAAIIFGVALFGLIFLLAWEQQALSLFRRLTRVLPTRFGVQLEGMLGSFVVGLHSLRSPLDVAAIALLTIGIWCAEALSYFLILTAFYTLPRDSLRALAGVVMMALVNLGIMIPAAPGGLGPYEAAGVFALATFKVNETLAASIALAAHSMQYLLVTGLGIFLAWREGISLLQKHSENGE